MTYGFSSQEHWLRIRTNNVIRTCKQRNKASHKSDWHVDGESALMLVCARLRYIASNDWGTHYLNMKHLTDMLAEELYCEAKIS